MMETFPRLSPHQLQDNGRCVIRCRRDLSSSDVCCCANESFWSQKKCTTFMLQIMQAISRSQDNGSYIVRGRRVPGRCGCVRVKVKCPEQITAWDFCYRLTRSRTRTRQNRALRYRQHIRYPWRVVCVGLSWDSFFADLLRPLRNVRIRLSLTRINLLVYSFPLQHFSCFII